LAAIHVLHRVELVGQTLQYALNELAQIAPGWLKSRVPVEWFERYGRKVDDYRLPKTETDWTRWATPFNLDRRGNDPTEVQTCPASAIWRQVWAQPYELKGEQTVVWRPNATLLPSAHS